MPEDRPEPNAPAPAHDPDPQPREGEDVNVLSGLPTDETPEGQLPEPQVTEPGPLPVPNPPGANPPYHSVTSPEQYPPYEKVSDQPPAGMAAANVPEPGQFVGQPQPPDAAVSLDRPAEPAQEDGGKK